MKQSKSKSPARHKKRELINHNKYSEAGVNKLKLSNYSINKLNTNIKKRFDEIMKNSKDIKIDMSKSCSNSPEKVVKANQSKDLITNSTAWTGFKTGEVFSKQGKF